MIWYGMMDAQLAFFYETVCWRDDDNGSLSLCEVIKKIALFENKKLGDEFWEEWREEGEKT